MPKSASDSKPAAPGVTVTMSISVASAVVLSLRPPGFCVHQNWVLIIPPRHGRDARRAGRVFYIPFIIDSSQWYKLWNLFPGLSFSDNTAREVYIDIGEDGFTSVTTESANPGPMVLITSGRKIRLMLVARSRNQGVAAESLLKKSISSWATFCLPKSEGWVQSLVRSSGSHTRPS